MPSRPPVKGDNKCSITILEGPAVTIPATFNPKELGIDKSVPWQKHSKSKGDVPWLEFTAAEPKTLAVELFFDTYEEGGSVYDKYIKKLERATLIMEGGAEKDRRPPTCMLKWGQFPKFTGVMESLSVKYTMFFSDGTPCRATASIKLKEAGKVDAKVERQPAGGGGGGGGDAGSSSGASSTDGSDGTDPRTERG